MKASGESVLARLVRRGREWLGIEPGNRRRFEIVHDLNVWQDEESLSGPGSRRDSGSVAEALAGLEAVCRDHGVRSIADIPCGDFNWMPVFLAQHPEIAYRGFDIVPALIEGNRRKHPGIAFEILDVTREVPPRADLIFCKDLFNHLRYADVRRAIDNMAASGSGLLLASNNFGSRNVELHRAFAGETRGLDICVAPLACPPPIWSTHYLGLWRLAELKRRE